MAIMISIGRWGGAYLKRAWGLRVCLGWIAITIMPIDGDIILGMAGDYQPPAEVKSEAG